MAHPTAAEGAGTGTAEPQSPPRTDFARDVLDSINAVTTSPTAVEMQPISGIDASSTPAIADPGIGPTDQPHHEAAAPATAAAATENSAAPNAATSSQRGPKEPPDITAAQDSVEDGIGPATERPDYNSMNLPGGSQVVITLLLHSTDTRHPYIIDEGYLRRRNIEVDNGDPTNMSVYTLKELIMRDWRPEWEAKPSSPSSVRLIHMGRMLDDKWNLKDARFACGPHPHVVHMTIKPQEVIDEEDARIAKGSREGGRVGGGCRCVVM